MRVHTGDLLCGCWGYHRSLFLEIVQEVLTPWYLQRFASVHCGAHCSVKLCVRRTWPVQNTQFVQFCFWRRGGTCYSSAPSGPIFAHVRGQCCNVTSLFVASSLQDESVFGLWLQESGEDFLVYGCASTSLDKFPFARAKTLVQTHFHLPSC